MIWLGAAIVWAVMLAIALTILGLIWRAERPPKNDPNDPLSFDRLKR